MGTPPRKSRKRSSGLSKPGRTGLPERLPSGRRLVVDTSSDRERLEVVAPTGDVEISIELTPKGPVLRFPGPRVAIEAAGELDLACDALSIRTAKRFDVRAGGDVAVRTEGEFNVRSRGDTNLVGDWINLNCEERAGTGYHDDPERVGATTAALPAATTDASGSSEGEDGSVEEGD